MGPDGLLPRRLLLPAVRALEPRTRRSQPSGADRSSQQSLLFLLHRAVAAGGLLLHRPADRRRGGTIPDELDRRPHLGGLSLSAAGSAPPVLSCSGPQWGRPSRADEEGQIVRPDEAG